MALTIREQIIGEIVAALGAVTTSDGYYTDIGQNIMRSMKKLDIQKDAPCIVVSAGQETVSKREYGKVFCNMPLEVEAIHAIDALTGGAELAEAMLGDLLKILTKSKLSSIAKEVKYTKGGATGYPDPGERSIAVQVSMSIDYTFAIGDPYTA